MILITKRSKIIFIDWWNWYVNNKIIWYLFNNNKWLGLWILNDKITYIGGTYFIDYILI